MKDQKVNDPGISKSKRDHRLAARHEGAGRAALMRVLIMTFVALWSFAGISSGLSAQSINWSDPQSPILKAVVMQQRLANEREVGNILVLRGGRPFAGVTRMTLVTGDSLVTGDQTAVIGYADQSWEAVVHPDTQVDFRGGEVKVSFGRMFAQLKPTTQKLLPITVSSNYGSITAGEGSFEIDISEERAIVTVISGSLELTRPSAQVVTLRARDEAVLIADAPLVTRPVSGQNYDEITQRITALSNLGVVAALAASPGAQTPAVPRPAAQVPSESQAAAPQQAAAEKARNRNAQTLLNELGYDAGPPDGVAGPRTLRAVAAFRLDRQLPGTTEIDDALIAALREAPPRRSSPSRALVSKPAAEDSATSKVVPEKDVAAASPASPPKAPAVPPKKSADSTKIPALIGLDFEQARVKLEESRQLIGRVVYQQDAKAAPGTVLEQRPLPGSNSRAGGSVDLIIARAATAEEKKPDDVMTAEAVAAALGVPPPPPPPSSSAGSTEKAATGGSDFLGAKGYLGSQDETAGLFKPEQKLTSQDTGSRNVLSREELSACLRIEDDYLAQKLRVDRSSQKQDATADEIAALDVRLDEMLPKTDPSKPETLEAYNALLDQRLRLFSEYKDKILPEARQNERQLRAIQRSFQEDCGRRPYRAEDLEAARKEAALQR